MRDTQTLNGSVKMKVLFMEIFYWFGWSFGTYQTVYLQNNGMDSSYIGILNAISSIVAIIAMTFWGIISDKMNSIKKTLIMALLAAMVLFGSIGFLPASASFAPIMFLIYCPIANFAKGSLGTLIDNFTVRSCTQNGLNYGINRGIGSFTYTIGCLLLSLVLVPLTGVKYTFMMYAIAAVPGLLFIFSIPDPKVEQKKKAAKLNPKELFKNYYYVTFLIFVFIAYIPLNCEFGFVSYLMEARNVSLDSFGVVCALRAVTEVPILFIMNPLRKRFKLKYIMIAGISVLLVESLLTAFFAHSLLTVSLITSLVGIGNGILIGTTSNYLYKLAPEHLKATAHTLYGAVTAIAAFVGSLAGGFAFKYLGATRFYIVLFALYLTAIIFFILSIVLYKGRANPGDSLD